MIHLPISGGTRLKLRTSRIPELLGRRIMLCVAALLLCACSKVVPLQTGLNDQDANEIALVLKKDGIESDKQRTKEGVLLMVDEKDLSRATEAMNAAGLPRRSKASLGEVFKKQGMISTPLEERVRYIHGLSEELGYTLQQFDRVISARVHVVLPERVAPGEPILPSSAAVFIKYQPPLDEDVFVPRVRRLVASSIPGLGGDDGRSKVSVVMTPSELTPPSIEWRTVGPFKVEEGAVNALRLILALLAAAIVFGIGVAALQIVKRNPKGAAWLDALASRMAEIRLRKEGKA